MSWVAPHGLPAWEHELLPERSVKTSHAFGTIDAEQVVLAAKRAVSG
jgi:hypothetical protein